jgi:hypothetical protein
MRRGRDRIRRDDDNAGVAVVSVILNLGM